MRAAEIIKENPDIDQAEAERLAQAERKAMLRGESVDLDTLRKRQESGNNPIILI